MAIKSSVSIYTGEGGVPYTFVWVNTPGILILLAAFISGKVQSSGFGEMLTVLGHTIVGLRSTILSLIHI